MIDKRSDDKPTNAMNLTDNVFFFGYPDPMEYWPLVLLMFGTFISGILIGSIGVGGVAIVPMLVLIGVDGKVAVTSSMLAYIFVAVSAIIVHAKSTKLTAENIRQLTIMCVSSFPTALLAGYVLTLISANVAILICASVALLTSIKSIVEFAKKKCQQNSTPLQTSSEPSPALEDGSTTIVGQSTEDEESHDSSPEMVNVSDDETENAKTATNATSDTTIDSVIFTYIGVITGFGSGLTGTSGPVVALPQIFLTRCVWQLLIQSQLRVCSSYLSPFMHLDLRWHHFLPLRTCHDSLLCAFWTLHADPHL